MRKRTALSEKISSELKKVMLKNYQLDAVKPDSSNSLPGTN